MAGVVGMAWVRVGAVCQPKVGRSFHGSRGGAGRRAGSQTVVAVRRAETHTSSVDSARRRADSAVRASLPRRSENLRAMVRPVSLLTCGRAAVGAGVPEVLMRVWIAPRGVPVCGV